MGELIDINKQIQEKKEAEKKKMLKDPSDIKTLTGMKKGGEGNLISHSKGKKIFKERINKENALKEGRLTPNNYYDFKVLLKLVGQEADSNITEDYQAVMLLGGVVIRKNVLSSGKTFYDIAGEPIGKDGVYICSVPESNLAGKIDKEIVGARHAKTYKKGEIYYFYPAMETDSGPVRRAVYMGKELQNGKTVYRFEEAERKEDFEKQEFLFDPEKEE